MIHGVVARRGIQAIQLTPANKFDLTELVHGRLRQSMHLEPGISTFHYEITFERNGHSWTIKAGEWMLVSPEGLVAIMDNESFRSWFETVSVQDALSASVSDRGSRTGDRT